MVENRAVRILQVMGQFSPCNIILFAQYFMHHALKNVQIIGPQNAFNSFLKYDICISIVVVNCADTGKISQVLTSPIFMG
jgi:hypothetical protein